MLARLQQLITVAIAAGALIWLSVNWAERPLFAIAGFALAVLGYALVLGAEFMALKIVDDKDEALSPTWGELLKAWLGEVKVAPRIFCWRQPFREHCVPDHLSQTTVAKGQRGVVFIHGFFCNRGFWTPWLRRLRSTGNAFAAVSLEPVFGSIDEYAHLIDAAVVKVTEASGAAPVLVCHSMGGLVARAWLRTAGAERVHHIVTIGTPHAGTWLAQFSKARNGSEMRVSSPWLMRLAQDEGQAQHVRFTCWYSNCDNIVFPTRTATLEGADNRLVRAAAHVQLAFHPVVVASTLAIIGAM